MNNTKTLVTGGAGYVGSKLVPKLLETGHEVAVIDWMIYGKYLPDDELCTIYETDLRNSTAVKDIIEKTKPKTVIDLASISNDPMGDIKPSLTKEVNYIAQKKLIDICIKNNVNKFIYASSSSVYGVNDEENITEDIPLAPISIYSKTKADIEIYLKDSNSEDFHTTVIRPATVCGYSPRQRLDLIVNLLTYHGYYNKKIRIEGGERVRPHIHIDDMVDSYLTLLKADEDTISGKVYNCGAEYMTLNELGEKVQKATKCEIYHTKGPDRRSHRLNSERIKAEAGVIFKKNVDMAISDLINAFDNNLIDVNDKRVFNLAWYKHLIENNLLT
jgi:nucleoside-diphosphate-sugar epimerase